jgi:hypothetical protein
MSSDRETLREHTEVALDGTDGGLRASDVYDELVSRYNLDTSERTVNEVLRNMAEEGTLNRRRMSDGSRGRPPYYYFLPEGDRETQSAPVSYVEDEGEQATFFMYQDNVESATVKARGDTEPPQDDERTHNEALDQFVEQVGHDVLEQIADSHGKAPHFVQRIKDIATDLGDEDPAELLTEMTVWTVESINDLAEEIRELREQGMVEQWTEKANKLENFRDWANRYYRNVWRLDQLVNGDDPKPLLYLPRGRALYALDDYREARINATRDELYAHFEKRIIGNSVLEVTEVSHEIEEGVGTDSSVADIQIRNEEAFAPRTELSVFTAAAALEAENGTYTDFDFTPQDYEDYHDPKALENGLVISSGTRHDLGPGELDHARPAALDLRQYVENLRVSMGDARWRPSGETEEHLGRAPRVDLVFGDGRVFPLVHHLKDYRQDNAYGRLVRNEVERFFKETKFAEDDHLGGIYAAAVKRPMLAWLAPLVFYYLNIVAGETVGELSDDGIPEEVYRYRITDEIVSHLLFIGYEETTDDLSHDELLTTCRVRRCFADIALGEEDYPPVFEDDTPVDERSDEDWMEFFEEKREKRDKEYGQRPLDREEYEPYAYLCANSAVLMGYGAPASLYLGQHDARMTLPRIEVLTSADDPSDEDMMEAMSWFARNNTGDMDHMTDEYSSVSDMPVLIPRVVEQAHEASVFVQKRMHQEVENELRKFISELN